MTHTIASITGNSRYRLFDRTRLRLRPLAERTHDLDLSCIKDCAKIPVTHPDLHAVANDLHAARSNDRSRLLMMGAHLLRAGVQRYIIDLLEQGFLSGIAVNGAGGIHDYEFALIGATTENVRRYIKSGEFGLWHETGALNEIAAMAHHEQIGLGEALGREIIRRQLPHSDISIAAACYRLKVPFTIHVSIGYDIIHEHPNACGAALGATSYTDFLIFAALVENLQHGVIMNFGSAIMAPEVFLKALAMARNVNAPINEFTSLVCDLQRLPDKWSTGITPNTAAYYFRPLKTMLLRTVADGGTAYYIRDHHSATIPQLWSSLQKSKHSDIASAQRTKQ